MWGGDFSHLKILLLCLFEKLNDTRIHEWLSIWKENISQLCMRMPYATIYYLYLVNNITFVYYNLNRDLYLLPYNSI